MTALRRGVSRRAGRHRVAPVLLDPSPDDVMATAAAWTRVITADALQPEWARAGELLEAAVDADFDRDALSSFATEVGTLAASALELEPTLAVARGFRLLVAVVVAMQVVDRPNAPTLPAVLSALATLEGLRNTDPRNSAIDGGST